MAGDLDMFRIALSRLREDLRDGRPGPGEPLLTADLAASLKISATPIREAISQLAGEGLLDDQRGRGKFALRYAAEDVEGFYRLHGAYVGLAIDARTDAVVGDGSAPAALSSGVTAPMLRGLAERFWSGLVHRAAEPIVRAHQRTADQLAVLRLVEPRVIDDVRGEIIDLMQSVASSPASLKAKVYSYHRRRERVSRALASALRDLKGERVL